MILVSPLLACAYVTGGLLILLTIWAYQFRHAPPKDPLMRKRLRDEMWEYDAFYYKDQIHEAGMKSARFYPGRGLGSFLGVSIVIFLCLAFFGGYVAPWVFSTCLFLGYYGCIELFFCRFSGRGHIPLFWGLAIILTGAFLPLLNTAELQGFILDLVKMNAAKNFVMWAYPSVFSVPFIFFAISVTFLIGMASYRGYNEATVHHLSVTIVFAWIWVELGSLWICVRLHQLLMRCISLGGGP